MGALCRKGNEERDMQGEREAERASQRKEKRERDAVFIRSGRTDSWSVF